MIYCADKAECPQRLYFNGDFMATATSDKTKKKELTLADREKAIIAKYGPGTKFNRKLVKGSLHFDNSRQKFTIELICSFHGCGERRRVATSDLHQVSMCEEHTKETRNMARAAARVKAAKKAKPAKAKKAKPAKPAKATQPVTQSTMPVDPTPVQSTPTVNTAQPQQVAE